MTSFVNGSDPAANADGKPTNFQQPGGANNDGQSAEDTAVILEIGGRKYTKTDLEKKILNADAHIERLTKERADDRKLLEEVRDSMKSQVDLKEVLSQIKSGQQPAPKVEPKTAEQAPVDVEAIAASVMGRVEQAAALKQQEANWNEVTATLTKHYGTATQATVEAVAAEAGYTLDEAAQLARTKPKAFLKLFPDLTVKAKPSMLPTGNVRGLTFDKPKDGPTGYLKATTTKDQIRIYQEKLAKLAG